MWGCGDVVLPLNNLNNLNLLNHLNINNIRKCVKKLPKTCRKTMVVKKKVSNIVAPKLLVVNLNF